LPSRKPGLVTDSTADQLASAPKPVNRLRRTQLQKRLHVRRPQRTVDEILDEGGAALIAQRARRDSLQGSLWSRRGGEQGIEDSCESPVLLRADGHLMSERGSGGGHTESLHPVVSLKQSKQTKLGRSAHAESA
jgi:hypothetical protein